MDEPFFRAQRAAVFEGYARELGVEAGDWESGGVRFAARAADYVWPYDAQVITAPGGAVVSVAPDLLDIAKARPPAKHHHVVDPAYLNPFAAAAVGQGRNPTVSGTDICWALRTIPPEPDLVPGLAFESWDLDRMKAEMAVRRFENGLGEVGVAGREFRNRWALAVVDADGEPVAIAGVFATAGLDEIGVDVVREHRGRGLGAAVVAKSTREILERGGIPLYGCSAANIRSQRTALATGYAPVFASASVS